MSHSNKYYLLLISAIIILYIFYINIFAINMPIGDDYDLIRVKFILSTQKLSWIQRLNVLIAPANDHRILIPRLMALFDYFIEGFINYRTIIWISNFSILGIVAFWMVSLQRNGLSLRYLLPIVFWYLNPFLYDLNLWGMNGVQHTTLNLFVFATLYILTHYSSPLPTFLAYLLAFAATFTNGNGFLVFPAGLAILLLAGEWKKSGLWSVGMIIALLAYFLNYSVGQATKVTFSVQFFQNLVVSFAALSGGWMAAFKGTSQTVLLWGAFAVGLITLLALTVWLAFSTLFTPIKGQNKQARFWVGIFLFSIMTIGIIAVSRGGRDVYSVFTSRYSLYPLHLLTLVYIMLLMWKPVKERWIAGAAVLFGISFAIASLYQYGIDADIRRRSLIADHYNWRHHRKLITHFRSELADFFTQPAYDKGIYRFTDFPLASAEPALAQPVDTASLQPVQLTLSSASKPVDFFGHPQTVWQFTLENKDCPQPGIGKGKGVFIVLKSRKNTTYLLPTWPSQAGKKRFLTQGKIYAPGFKVTLYNENFKPDDYQIGLLYSTKEGNKLQFTSNVLRVDALHAQLLTRP